jgi:hypothetical protein
MPFTRLGIDAAAAVATAIALCGGVSSAQSTQAGAAVTGPAVLQRYVTHELS